MNSEDVPHKFAEWLLSMGCPPEKIPPLDKVKQMCRGDYYMVWRNMMERVYSKQVIKEKRLQVFCDDIKMSRNVKKNKNEHYIEPEELSVWRQDKEMSQKLETVEIRATQNRQTLNDLMRKVSNKVIQRDAVNQRVRDVRRRAWLLERVREELESRKENLQQTITIANAFQPTGDDTNVHMKLDKCISLLNKQNAHNSTIANGSASVTPTNDSADTDIDEYLSNLVTGTGSVLWSQLYQRRANIVEKLSAINSQVLPTQNQPKVPTMTAQSVLANTAALHSLLVLDSVKHQNQINNLRERLAVTLDQFHSSLSDSARELLVLRCERAMAEARVAALRSQLDDIVACRGNYRLEGEQDVDDAADGTMRRIAKIDRALPKIILKDGATGHMTFNQSARQVRSVAFKYDELKKVELKVLITNLVKTERKIQNVMENVQTIFSGFRRDSDTYRYSDAQRDPRESIASIRQFYDQRRNKITNKMELSLDLDISDGSLYNGKECNAEPKFTDELKLYLSKFNLEKNRKLVLESGETVWIFESVQQSAHRLYLKCHEDLATALFWPALTISMNVSRLLHDVQWHETIKEFIEKLRSNCNRKNITISDISPMIRQGDSNADKLKKRLNDALLSLQKTEKTIDIGQENLRLWSDNKLKQYVSKNRTIDGRTFRDIENVYLNNLNPSL